MIDTSQECRGWNLLHCWHNRSLLDKWVRSHHLPRPLRKSLQQSTTNKCNILRALNRLHCLIRKKAQSSLLECFCSHFQLWMEKNKGRHLSIESKLWYFLVRIGTRVVYYWLYKWRAAYETTQELAGAHTCCRQTTTDLTKMWPLNKDRCPSIARAFLARKCVYLNILLVQEREAGICKVMPIVCHFKWN
jgi:hypothetical protein